MDCVLTSSEVDLGLPHSLDYLYKGYDGLCAHLSEVDLHNPSYP
jgi:hypothetical protein